MDDSPASRRTWWWLAGICVAALVLRVGTLAVEWRVHDLEGFARMHADAREYLAVGEQLHRDGTFADQASVFARNRAVVRTPGFPIAYALIRGAGLPVAAALPALAGAIAVVGAVVPLLTFFLARQVVRGDGFALLAAGAAAASPTGVLASALPLADVPFVAIFVGGLLAQRAAARGGSWVWALTAALLYATALLVRPSLLFWPIVVPLVWVAQRWGFGLRAKLGPAMLIAAVVAATIGGWTLRNVRAENVAAFSTISTRNLRFCVQPYVQLWAAGDGWPDGKIVRRHYRDLQYYQTAYLLGSPDPTVAGLEAWRRAEAREAILGHPLLSAAVYGRNVWQNLTAENLNVGRQLDGIDASSPLWKQLAGGWTIVTGSLPASLLWLAGIAGGVVLGRRDRATWWPAIGLGLTWLYFAGLTGTTQGEGSRIMYAVEPLALALIARAAWSIWNRRAGGARTIGA